MNKFLVFFIATLFVVAANAQGTCLAQDYANLWGLPYLLGEPTTVQPGEFCNADGTEAKELCCDSTILQNIANYFHQFQANIDGSVEAFRQATQNTDISSLIYAALANGIPTGIGANTQIDPSLQDAINAIVSAYQDFFRDGPTNFGKCLSGIQQYYAGILCGFCSPNWENMVDISDYGTSYVATFTLSDNTCPQIGEACGGFVESLYPIFQAIIQLEVALGVPEDQASLVWPCASGNCQEFACDFVHGFDIPAGNPDFAAMFSGVGRRAIGMTESTEHVKDFFKRQSSSTSLRTGPNSYGSTGYDAFAAGANSKLTSSNNSSAFTVIPSIFVALTALFFLLF